MTIDLTEIVIALIGLCAAFVTAVAVPWINSKTTEKQRYDFQVVARIMVEAAEQMHKAGILDIPKREYVIQRLQEKYPKLSWEEIVGYLESSVFRMNQFGDCE